MASGRHDQASMEDIRRMEDNIEEQRYSSEASVRPIGVYWRAASPTIDFHRFSISMVIIGVNRCFQLRAYYWNLNMILGSGDQISFDPRA